MSLFSKILDKLGLHKEKEQEKPATTGTVGSAPKPAATATPTPKPTPTATPTAKPTTPTAQPNATTANPATVSAREEADNISKEAFKPVAAAPKPMSKVDVTTMLEQKAKGTGLNWKQSISDLLTLLDIDHSYNDRVELAKELGAPQEVMGDSARMNTWLHKEVLRKIAENGGNIPQELLD